MPRGEMKKMLANGTKGTVRNCGELQLASPCVGLVTELPPPWPPHPSASSTKLAAAAVVNFFCREDT